MTEQEAFDHIDSAIEFLRESKGLPAGVKVATKSKSDWLVFNWRQLTWNNNNINYLIEVYPGFNQQGVVTGWNLYAAAFYDQEKQRFYIKKMFAENSPLVIIARQAETLIQESFLYISNIQKDQIPFAIALKK